MADPAPGSRLAFRLDGAHTGESAAAAAQWFADEATGAAAAAAAAGAAGAAPQQPRQPQPRPPCALVFNCLAEREPRRLMDPLARGLAAARLLPLSAALFVPAGDGAAAAPLGADLAWQRRLAGHWADAVAEAQRQPRACGHGGLGGGGGGTAAPPAAAAGAADAAAAARRGVHVLPSAASAVGWLRRAAAAGALPPRTTVLVTGSLYLVADALRALAPPKV